MIGCSCRTDLEAKLLERFRASEPKATDHTVELKGYGIIISDKGLDLRAYMPVEMVAKHTAKNGNQRVRKTSQNMFFSYCPFCGVAMGDKS